VLHVDGTINASEAATEWMDIVIVATFATTDWRVPSTFR